MQMWLNRVKHAIEMELHQARMLTRLAEMAPNEVTRQMVMNLACEEIREAMFWSHTLCAYSDKAMPCPGPGYYPQPGVPCPGYPGYPGGPGPCPPGEPGTCPPGGPGPGPCPPGGPGTCPPGGPGTWPPGTMPGMPYSEPEKKENE